MLQHTDPEKLSNKEGSRGDYESHCAGKIEWTLQMGVGQEGQMGMRTEAGTVLGEATGIWEHLWDELET